MIHVALYKWKPHAHADDLGRFEALVEVLPSSVSEIRSIVFRENLHSIGSKLYTHAIVASFDNATDLARYRQHPNHQPLVHFVEKFAESRLGIDLDIGGSAIALLQ